MAGVGQCSLLLVLGNAQATAVVLAGPVPVEDILCLHYDMSSTGQLLPSHTALWQLTPARQIQIKQIILVLISTKYEQYIISNNTNMLPPPPHVALPT